MKLDDDVRADLHFIGCGSLLCAIVLAAVLVFFAVLK